MKPGGAVVSKFVLSLVLPLVFLVVLAWGAHQVYLWLVPLVPSLMTIIGLVLVLSLLSRVWSRKR